MILVPSNNHNIYKIKKAKQIPIYGKKEKKLFTAILFVDFGGRILLTQSIWKKKLAASLPIIVAFEEVKRRNH